MKIDQESITDKLRLSIKSGKFKIGYNSTIKVLSGGSCKLIIISDNCPPVRRLELEYYAMLVKCPIHHFPGNNKELGAACGKNFSCSCIGIIDPGDANFSIYSN